MKVRVLDGCIQNGTGKNFLPGDTLDMADDEAKVLIKEGKVEAVKSEKAASAAPAATGDGKGDKK